MAIHEVIIQVGDIDAAVAFYGDVCGFEHVRTVEHESAHVAEMHMQGQRISLVQADEPGVHLALATEDAEAARRRLKRTKATLDAEGAQDVDGASWLPFQDPWGNKLGYWQPPRPSA